MIQGTVSIFFGISDESTSLAGFGAESLVEVVSALFVFWRLRGEVEIHSEINVRRDRQGTLGIVVLFIIITILIIGTSARQILKGLGPESAWAGTIIATVSSGIMLYLWILKKDLETILAVEQFC